MSNHPGRPGLRSTDPKFEFRTFLGLKVTANAAGPTPPDFFEGDTLRLEARTALGKLYDAFTLKKRSGLGNELIEQGPGTPERHPRVPAEKPKAKATAALRN